MIETVFVPFADDAAVLSVGGLQIENGLEAVVMYGQLTIRKDGQSRAAAIALANSLLAIAAAIDPAAPEIVENEAGALLEEVPNPFG